MNVNKKKVEKIPPVVQEKAVEKNPSAFIPILTLTSVREEGR